MTISPMRAARMHDVGKAMRIETLPRPEPGPGEVRVAVHACNVVRRRGGAREQPRRVDPRRDPAPC